MIDTQIKLRRIGAGFCGTVWAAADHDSAFKREDGGPERSLSNDFEMHQRIERSLKEILPYDTKNPIPHIQIPACYDLFTPTSTWWGDNLQSFPQGYQPCTMIHAQRIPPVSKGARRLLTERYCPKPLISEIMTSDTNRDCLIRPYLGRRRIQTTSSRSKFQAFSLRNYPLHLDQMEEPGIPREDIIGYARTMADALAVMHWVAEVDGNDVEFVLAAPNNKSGQTWSNVLGKHQMWLLDFDLVRTITLDEQGVEQAAKAFCKNDPFFPRPASLLWRAFSQQYLATSAHCLTVKHPSVT
ncbi:zinc finger protein-domain-containing protein [Aspergillus karnatakaensis]|uniref:zinc finger protein n=1 Tax=Aspergillus karnatakaensis TaxID=1810916 RepID=UPI003CCCC536